MHSLIYLLATESLLLAEVLAVFIVSSLQIRALSDSMGGNAMLGLDDTAKFILRKVHWP